MKKIVILAFYCSLSFVLSTQEVRSFKIDTWNRIIYQNITSLNEGSKSFLRIYDTKYNLISQTMEVTSEILHIFEEGKRIVLSDTYYPSDISYTYIYDQNGKLLQEIKNPGITYSVGFIDKYSLFYLIVFYDVTNDFSARNKLIIFDLSGKILHEYIYSKKDIYVYYLDMDKVTIELIQPELP